MPGADSNMVHAVTEFVYCGIVSLDPHHYLASTSLVGGLQSLGMDGAAERVKKLVAGQVNLRDEMGRTALWRAVQAGQTHEVESLIDAGANVAAVAVTDDNPHNGGATPLTCSMSAWLH